MSSNVSPAHGIAASELRHQLRTPLNHIIGYGEILLEEFPESAHRPSVESLVREARGMVECVQQVMGGENPPETDSALSRLRERLGTRIQIVLTTLDALNGSMPDSAHEDLRRIAAAARALDRTLAEGVPAEATSRMRPQGNGPVHASVQPAVHPMDTRIEPRPGSVTATGRILVVDDDAMNRDMLSRQLERQGHQVATAADGSTALAMLRANRFDMVLLDLMMPGMNGFEVLEHIKCDPALSGIAVILVSALDEMDSVVRSIDAGAEDYLFKPVNPTLLRARIKSTLDKLRAEENVRRKQRLESIGLLAAGIAHDFNNLLTGIIGHAQLLEYSLTEPADKEAVAAIVTAGERAADLTRQMLAYSGKTMFHMQLVDLAATFRETESLIHASLPRKVTLHLNLATVPAIVGDENQIRQVLLNLVLNATESIGTDTVGSLAIATGGEKVAAGARFDVAPEEIKPGFYSWFEVRDSGCGMDAVTAGKMFEPFFTTKFLGRGLGLAAVAGIVTAHHGLLRVTTSPGKGTAVRVCFPATDEIDQRCEAPDGSYVMVVDDEPVIRQIVKVALERAGRKVLTAASGEEAIETLKKFSREVVLILLDWKMPLMDGAETLSRLRAIRPEVKVIVSSGLGQSDAETHFREAHVTGYLQKPYRMSELVDLLERTLPESATA